MQVILLFMQVRHKRRGDLKSPATRCKYWLYLRLCHWRQYYVFTMARKLRTQARHQEPCIIGITFTRKGARGCGIESERDDAAVPEP